MKKLNIIIIIILICCSCSAVENVPYTETPVLIETSSNYETITEKLLLNYKEKRIPNLWDALDRSIGEWEVDKLAYRAMYELGDDGNDPEKDVIGKRIKIDEQYKVYFENTELPLLNASEIDARTLYVEMRLLHGNDAKAITHEGYMLLLSFDNRSVGINAGFSLLVCVEWDEVYLIGTENLNIGGAYSCKRI